MFDYAHVRLARNITSDDVHATLERKDAVWQLTVVNREKPFLFSNVSGTLSYFGMEILRGQAMTTPDGLVLDLFQFTDEEGFLQKNAVAPTEILRTLRKVVAAATTLPSFCGGRRASPPKTSASPADAGDLY